MARKNNHDVKVGIVGLLIGVILGSATALMSTESSLEGLIIRFEGSHRPHDMVIEGLRAAASRARRW